MHGVARSSAPLSAAEEEANRKKIDKYNQAKKLALAARSSKKFDSHAEIVSAALLSLNPDFYSLWNFRRQLFFSLFPVSSSSSSSSSSTPLVEFLSKELQLTEKALMRNPKSYSAWHHRLWCLDRGTINLKEELKMCKKMLKLDQRNFHAWNYRRSVCKRVDQALHDTQREAALIVNNGSSGDSSDSGNISIINAKTISRVRIDLSVLEPAIYYCADKDIKSSNLISEPIRSRDLLQHEFDYTTEMINENFSNFSAWHHRSFIIQTITTSTTSSLPSRDSTHSATASSSSSSVSPSVVGDVTTESLFNLISSEFLLLKTAFFTDPTDQSIWIYHRWLLGRLLSDLTAKPFFLTLPAAIPIISLSAPDSVASSSSSSSSSSSVSVSSTSHRENDKDNWQDNEHWKNIFSETIKIIWKEYETLHELLTVEANCKYALLEKSIVLHTLWHYSRCTTLTEAILQGKDGALDIVGESSQQKVEKEIDGMMKKCVQLDPMRRNYYEEMRTKFEGRK